MPLDRTHTTVCSGIILLPYFSCFSWYPNEYWGALCILNKFHQKEWRLQIKSVRAIMWRKGIKYIAVINELAWQMEHWMWYSLTFSKVCNTSPSDIFINKVDKYVLRKNIARWTHVVVVNCFWRKCHLFTSHHKEISGEILQKSVLDLNLFDVFINGSDDGVRNRMHSALRIAALWRGMRIQNSLNELKGWFHWKKMRSKTKRWNMN